MTQESTDEESTHDDIEGELAAMETDGENDEEGDDQEAQAPRVPRSICTPSLKEIEEHNATHMPYRSWCTSCVAGRGVASPHVGNSEKKIVNEVGMDYCLPRGTKDGAPKVLAVRSAIDGTTLSLVIPKKGLPEEWVAARLAKAVQDIGLGDVTLITKSRFSSRTFPNHNSQSSQHCYIILKPA